jgi:hypothetical protein
MPRNTRTTAALGLALLAAVVPAAGAAPARTPVPRGEVQHTVTEISYPAAKNTVHHDTVRLERWTSASASRMLETNITSGRIHSDCQFRVGAPSRCWTSSFKAGNPGVIHINPGSDSFVSSWIDVGRGEKQQLHGPQANVHLTGTTTYLGRKALQFEYDPIPTSKGGTSTSSVIVDAKTYYPLRQEFVITGDPYTAPNGKTGKSRFDEVIAVKVMKVTKVRGVQLTIDPHPGAKIVHDGRRR